MSMVTNTETADWVWVHAGEQRAVNLRQVTDIVFEQAHTLTATLYLASAGTEGEGRTAARCAVVSGAEAEALHSYLKRQGRHLEDLVAE